MSITLQIRDSDLKTLHPQLNNDIWPSTLSLIESRKGFCDTTTNTLSFYTAQIEGTEPTWATWVTTLVGKSVNIVDHYYSYRITAYTYTVPVEDDPDTVDVDETVAGQVDLTLVCDQDSTLEFLVAGDTEVTFQIGGYQVQIAEAYRRLKNDLSDKGIGVADINATDNFREAQIFKAFELIFRDFKMEEDDRWDILMKDYASQYSTEMRETNLSTLEGITIRNTRIQL